MAFEDDNKFTPNLDFLDLEGLGYSDEELLQISLASDTSEYFLSDFEKWDTYKASIQDTNWLELDAKDKWRCFIIENLVQRLKDIKGREINEVDEDGEGKFDWEYIFRLIKNFLDLDFSESGFLLNGDEEYEFAVRYYKVLLNQWDLSDDLEGVQENELLFVIHKLGNQSQLGAFLTGLLMSANNYFVELNVGENDDNNDDGGGPSPLELAPA